MRVSRIGRKKYQWENVKRNGIAYFIILLVGQLIKSAFLFGSECWKIYVLETVVAVKSVHCWGLHRPGDCYICKVASVREVGSKSLFEMRGGRPVLNPLSDIFRGLSQPHPSPPPPSSSPHQLFFNSVFTVSRFFHQPLNRAAFISQFFLLYSRRRPKNPALYRSYFISLIT